MADLFKLQTPKGELVKVRTPNGNIKMEIRWDEGFGPKISKTFNTVQGFVDSECLRLCDQFVPKDTGMLKQSGIMHTQIGAGELKYRTPYARRWYYMPANFQQGSGSGVNAVGRGNYWFYRMKQQYRQQILDGAKREARKLM